MFPKKGNKFPKRTSPGRFPPTCASVVADALRSELGGTHRAIKTVMDWTDASERTIKNWFGADSSPHGDYFLILLGKSDVLLNAVLAAVGRIDLAGSASRSGRAASNDADQHGFGLEVAHPPSAPPVGRGSPGQRSGASSDGPNDPNDDPDRDPINDPDRRRIHSGLNNRQRWFLRELAEGRAVRASDLRRRFDVSEKTPKRDIAKLQSLRLIRFVGSRRSGCYEICVD